MIKTSILWLLFCNLAVCDDFLSYFSNYGDEYNQSINYFSTASKLNASDYFSDYNNCLRDRRPRLCSKLVNKWYREASRIWKSPQAAKELAESYEGRPLDCKYRMQFQGAIERNYAINFVFTIEQTNCKVLANTPFGGSTFEIFALDAFALTACKYFDSNNGTYHVFCRIPRPEKSALSVIHCANVTAVLIYEHFDGFSESLHEWSAAYLPLRRLLVDNHQYCSNLSTYFPVVESLTVPSLNYENNLRWYGGDWLVESNLSNVVKFSWFHSLRKTINTAWQHRLKANKTVSYDHLPRFSVLKTTIPSLAASTSRSLALSEKYVFHPFIIDRNSYLSGAPSYFLPPLSTPITLQRSAMNYLFIGASHMRYNFDLLIQHFFNDSFLRNVNRKHDHLIVSNWRFDFIGNAKDMSQFLLKNVCTHEFLKDFQGKNKDMKNYTVILQTGAWDLSVAPLRNLIHNPQFGGGNALREVLRGVLNNSIPCFGLQHIVWLTSVPYPLCYNPMEADCGKHRNYRTNSAISAANQFFLQSLLSVNVRNIMLSIVDAFSIIKPRLLLNEDSEVLCLSHYLCRVYSSSYSFMGKETRDGSGVVTLLTPAGSAVVQSIIQALGWW